MVTEVACPPIMVAVRSSASSETSKVRSCSSSLFATRLTSLSVSNTRKFSQLQLGSIKHRSIISTMTFFGKIGALAPSCERAPAYRIPLECKLESETGARHRQLKFRSSEGIRFARQTFGRPMSTIGPGTDILRTNASFRFTPQKRKWLDRVKKSVKCRFSRRFYSLSLTEN
jgi:hypothetical protein